jgi:AcrR family transcriptional regulator
MINHRTIVGAERREKTRARLLKGALHVFSRFGSDAKVIDLVIKNAGVSRGTFYNYFRTNEELFIEVAKEVSNEIIRAVDPVVVQQKDPVARMACGVISVIRLAKRVPILAQFVVKGGPIAMQTGSLTTTVVPRDIRAGITGGHFTIADENLAFDLVLGPIIMAFHRIVQGEVVESYPNELAQSVLQSLGVSRKMAKKYAYIDFVDIELSEHSMLN